MTKRARQKPKRKGKGGKRKLGRNTMISKESTGPAEQKISTGKGRGSQGKARRQIKIA